MASIDTYRAAIRSAIRGYWSGKISQNQFLNAMVSTINRGLTQAWAAGAKECGVALQDLTIEERTALAQFINDQLSFVQKLALDIAKGSKDEKGKLGDIIYRADLWANKWEVAKANAHAMACKDQPQEFLMGATERHCKTCRGLHQRVYRNSVWVANNAVPPRNPRFQCGAVSHCSCGLYPTTKPITKGKFPVSLLVR